jgi:SOS-response transcriptional repressor LexA|tara:strand:- start:324 stop:581 length:258 start_codon:yes stop_codon:yes gene_type:complete
MQPSLASGDLILTRRTRGIAVGDIVVVDVGDAGKIIKRVSELSAETVVLAGDNSRLTSSFCDYPHKRSTIVGKLLLNLNFSFLSR